jgi:hypothetical protein
MEASLRQSSAAPLPQNADSIPIAGGPHIAKAMEFLSGPQQVKTPLLKILCVDPPNLRARAICRQGGALVPFGQSEAR